MFGDGPIVFANCPRCGEFRLRPSQCRCMEFRVWLVDTDEQFGMLEEDAMGVYAMDAERAAERFCCKYDATDDGELIVRDGGATVTVREVSTGDCKRFDVEAYTEPVYRACEVKDKVIADEMEA